MPQLHESLALILFQKCDYEAAVANYIFAGSNVVAVLSQFPDLIPGSLRTSLPLLGPRAAALRVEEQRGSGAAQSRAAAGDAYRTPLFSSRRKCITDSLLITYVYNQPLCTFVKAAVPP